MGELTRVKEEKKKRIYEAAGSKVRRTCFNNVTSYIRSRSISNQPIQFYIAGKHLTMATAAESPITNECKSNNNNDNENKIFRVIIHVIISFQSPLYFIDLSNFIEPIMRFYSIYRRHAHVKRFSRVIISFICVNEILIGITNGVIDFIVKKMIDSHFIKKERKDSKKRKTEKSYAMMRNEFPVSRRCVVTFLTKDP